MQQVFKNIQFGKNMFKYTFFQLYEKADVFDVFDVLKNTS